MPDGTDANGLGRAVARQEERLQAFDRACGERHGTLNGLVTDLAHEVRGMRDDLLLMREQLKGRSTMARIWSNVISALIGACAAVVVALFGQGKH